MVKIRMLQIAQYIAAAREGRRQDLEACLDAFGPGVEFVDEKGCSAVSLAAAKGHVDCVELLLARGCDIDSRDDMRCTPLLSACGGGFFEFRVRLGDIATARLLLKAGANVDAEGPKGSSTLMMASRRGDKKMVAELLGWGPNVDARDDAGMTALMYAADTGNAACAALLLEAGCDVEAVNHGGKTALALAKIGWSHGSKECSRTIEVHVEKSSLSGHISTAPIGKK